MYSWFTEIHRFTKQFFILRYIRFNFFVRGNDVIFPLRIGQVTAFASKIRSACVGFIVLLFFLAEFYACDVTYEIANKNASESTVKPNDIRVPVETKPLYNDIASDDELTRLCLTVRLGRGYYCGKERVVNKKKKKKNDSIIW